MGATGSDFQGPGAMRNDAFRGGGAAAPRSMPRPTPAQAPAARQADVTQAGPQNAPTAGPPPSDRVATSAGPHQAAAPISGAGAPEMMGLGEGGGSIAAGMAEAAATLPQAQPQQAGALGGQAPQMMEQDAMGSDQMYGGQIDPEFLSQLISLLGGKIGQPAASGGGQGMGGGTMGGGMSGGGWAA